ncbi:hypothetical protein [Streptomyces sp. NBC_00467]|uniref:hypothetical protein n=1 Tax=Streptomyces sp. NBC_00467 TaxID=2975752 RepID=UPI002E190BA1
MELSCGAPLHRTVEDAFEQGLHDAPGERFERYEVQVPGEVGARGLLVALRCGRGDEQELTCCNERLEKSGRLAVQQVNVVQEEHRPAPPTAFGRPGPVGAECEAAVRARREQRSQRTERHGT